MSQPPISVSNSSKPIFEPSTQTSTATTGRSITPIGPPTRTILSSPHQSSHIVNTLDLSTSLVHPENTSQSQSKLNNLHEYSLFNDSFTNKWENKQIFNPMKATYIETEQSQASVIT